MKAMEICKGGFIEKNGRLVEAKGRKGTILSDWRKNIIVPLKKRPGEDIIDIYIDIYRRNYKGISLLCTAYTRRF